MNIKQKFKVKEKLKEFGISIEEMTEIFQFHLGDPEQKCFGCKLINECENPERAFALYVANENNKKKEVNDG